MIKKEESGIEWWEFHNLQPYPNVRHGVFPKGNGDLKADYQKRAEICAHFGIQYLPLCRQVHKDGIVEVTEIKSEFIGEFDGAITQVPRVGLPILHADCQAALFYDPKTNTIANVHSGWRGSVLNIYEKTIEHLVRKGVKPENLIVCISPSLGPENAEFQNHKTELPSHFSRFVTKPKHFNFWEISKKQLLDCGVKEEAIEIASVCTYAHKEHFYSYRRDKDAERNMTLIALIS